MISPKLALKRRDAHISFMETIDAFALTVNGEPTPVPPQTTVAGLLECLNLDHRKVAVERNEEIVPRSAYQATRLASGDRLEIVHFIGGG